MKIPISKIPQAGINLSHSYKPEELDINVSNVEITRPVTAKVHCYRISNAVTVEGDLDSDFSFKCSRCLEEVKQPLKKKVKFCYMVNPGDSFIDITADLREEIILGYALKPLCKPDCKGLCPKCGKNLNEGRCGCK